MATNTGSNHRNGSVKERSQILNPSTGNYIKRDTISGKFIDVKTDGKPYKGIRKEAITIKSYPNVNKEIALKAEQAVIKFKNSKLINE